MDGAQSISSVPDTQSALLFGELLVSKGLLNEDDLLDVLDKQREQGGRIGEVLLRHNMLNDKDIELIIVNTPDTTHYEFCKQALEAGKHVVVEKPFTLNSKEGEELEALAKSKDLVLSVYQNRRWDGDFQTVQMVLEQQLLGRESSS